MRAGYQKRAYRLRCYPIVRQRRVLGRLFGASRFVWSWGLAWRTSAYQAGQTRLNSISLSRQFSAFRQASEPHWLAELPREPFSQVLRDQERALQSFFARRARYRRFRRRGARERVRFTLDQCRVQVERDLPLGGPYVQLLSSPSALSLASDESAEPSAGVPSSVVLRWLSAFGRCAASC